ncbi:head GIN domain-containing protein [Dinghuibacter silviterrae]|uniref:Putative autotransporter adhesin-like protein n=1 Tax=Dinghuibacter silviterrae TaxID=1539049 RepID=A0A4R8DRZ0_9BACT|nr:head GIN domain-containing protein [Dinghuibacter silviterrae]TDX00578.1 putative autotransporter adhesin-like protein [Dinghuibacter silviterrae]
MKRLLAALSLVVLASCHFGPYHVVRGNGSVQKEERKVGEFKRVDVRGFFNVYVTQGSDYKVELEGESNLLQYITTRVDGNRLIISTENAVDLTTNNDLNAYVTLPETDEVVLSGSGNIISQNTLSSPNPMSFSLNGSGDVKVAVDAPKVETSLAGSGKLALSGQTRDLKVDIAGSGTFSGDSLKSENGKVSIMGSGSAYIFSSVSLDVTIGGSGDVYYWGDPSISQHVYGSGSLNKR